jgi:hypothetical protein
MHYLCIRALSREVRDVTVKRVDVHLLALLGWLMVRLTYCLPFETWRVVTQGRRKGGPQSDA